MPDFERVLREDATHPTDGEPERQGSALSSLDEGITRRKRARSKAKKELSRQQSVGLWRGMYSDGHRLGVWINRDASIAGPVGKLLKKHKFVWIASKGIWCGSLIHGPDVINALSELYPQQFPLERGMKILGDASRFQEPFWAMAVMPELRQTGDKAWSLSFPQDTTTTWFFNKFRCAHWDRTSATWKMGGDLESIVEILSQIAIPERYLTIIRSGEAEPDVSPESAWKRYLVGVDPDDIVKERVTLSVDGSDGAMCTVHGEKRKDDERAAEDRRKAIQRAFYEPMVLLPLEEGIIEDLADRFSLMPHQHDGVRHFLTRTAALNADDMGLGKTRQTITAASHLAGGKVIVCPASLKDNWKREIRMVLPDAEPFIFENGLPDSQPEWLIVNYERLGSLLSALEKSDWRFVVAAFDEAHYIKEPSAQRTRNSFDLAKLAERKWLLTATPMLNGADETWTLLRLSGHPAGDIDLKTFNDRFTKSANDRRGLGDRISEWMIRRTKDVVLTLAGKYRQEPLVSATREQMNEYRKFMENDTLITLQKITLGRQWLERVKRGPILEMMGDLQPDAKAIIFCNFEETVQWLMGKLPNGSAVRITGKDDQKKKTEAEFVFQNDPRCRWLIGNIIAAGVGLNLTAATYVFFVSRPWTPAEQSQAEDRAYRIGQNDRVEVYVPTVPGTIDEKIRDLLISKGKVTNDVLAGAIEADRRKADEC
jgi:hypothetical protein